MLRKAFIVWMLIVLLMGATVVAGSEGISQVQIRFDYNHMATIEAALKAPTAVNQQKFQFCLKDGCPYIRVKGLGAYTKVDLGIVAYHFEVASGKKVQH